MKKIIFGAAAMIALASCTGKITTNHPRPVADGPEVSVIFDREGSRFESRAFFDDTSEAEPYEKIIKSAMIYIFDSQGTLIIRREFSESEISSLSAKLILPESVAGKECTFHALANYGYNYKINLSFEEELFESFETVSSYNDTYESVSNGYRKTTGFTMSATKRTVIQPQGTAVSFELKRTVAKIAVKVSVHEDLALELGRSKLKVENITVSEIPSRIWVFPRSAAYAYPTDYSLTQVSVADGDDYYNLFYLPEKPAAVELERLSLRIAATFDQDGNDYSTDDRVALQWDVRIDGDGDGRIRRNGYYRIRAQICGLSPALGNIRSFIVASEWETPVTQPMVYLY